MIISIPVKQTAEAATEKLRGNTYNVALEVIFLLNLFDSGNIQGKIVFFTYKKEYNFLKEYNLI